MNDIPANTTLSRLLADKGFFSKNGDLAAVAEALYAATEDQVNGMARKSIEAARERIAALTQLNHLKGELVSLTTSGTNYVLGDKSRADALVADMNEAGLSLTTQSSYFIQSETRDVNGALVSSTPLHVATQAERTAAEAAAYYTTVNGIEFRAVADPSTGHQTVYGLQRKNTAETATIADVKAAIADIDARMAPLLVTAAADILRLNAFVAERRPLAVSQLFDDSRKDQGKALDSNQAEFLALAEVATQRAQERRQDARDPLRSQD